MKVFFVMILALFVCFNHISYACGNNANTQIAKQRQKWKELVDQKRKELAKQKELAEQKQLAEQNLKEKKQEEFAQEEQKKQQETYFQDVKNVAEMMDSFLELIVFNVISQRENANAFLNKIQPVFKDSMVAWMTEQSLEKVVISVFDEKTNQELTQFSMSFTIDYGKFSVKSSFGYDDFSSNFRKAIRNYFSNNTKNHTVKICSTFAKKPTENKNWKFVESLPKEDPKIQILENDKVIVTEGVKSTAIVKGMKVEEKKPSILQLNP
jgi:hypothetical protein